MSPERAKLSVLPFQGLHCIGLRIPGLTPWVFLFRPCGALILREKLQLASGSWPPLKANCRFVCHGGSISLVEPQIEPGGELIRPGSPCSSQLLDSYGS